MNNSNIFETPILFLVFNRLDTTKKVYAKICEMKPARLYIASDGPREDKEGESQIVREVREFVLSQITWPCEVKTLFRENNLGCKMAISSAISWFFEHEEMGIILEDDCVPTKTFFYFCQKMLLAYKDDPKVMMVSGMNYFSEMTKTLNPPYFFSRYFMIWGWATWRRAWLQYDIKMEDYDDDFAKKRLKPLFPSLRSYLFWKDSFDLVKNGKMNTWDIQWCYTGFLKGGLTIVPATNQISNIGLTGVHATGKMTGSHFLDAYDLDMDFQLISQTSPYQLYDKSISHSFETEVWRILFVALLRKLKLLKTAKYVKDLFK